MRDEGLPRIVLVILATYAVLLICWSLVMRASARRSDAEGASDVADGLGGAPWAQRDADGGPAGTSPAAATGSWPPTS